jgi:superfamily II DNA or RNA helicase
MKDLLLQPVDSVNIRVRCDRGVAKELSDFLTFKVPGHEYMPAFRNKMWDGQIKLYNIHSQQTYAGLLEYVTKFASDRNYSYEVHPDLVTNDPQLDFSDFIESLDLHISASPITPHEHQIRAFKHAVNNDRCLLLSPTGSGKSLIIYMLLRYYLEHIDMNKRVLIVVPTTSLVTQLYNDFDDYSSESDWNVEDHCHKVFAGREKLVKKKRVIISTWQSIYKLPRSYFGEFSVVVGDECHLFKSKSLTSIMTKLEDCPYRFGTTGTLDGTQTHRLVIEGLFGRVFNVTTTKTLIKKSLLSDLEIDCITLEYPDYIRDKMKRSKYQEEIDFLLSNTERNEFICKLCNNIQGNTLVLFQYVEKHGRPLLKMIEHECNGRDVFFVYGGTDTELREKIRQLMEKKSNAIILASYGTFSTGISIKRLHNIVFSSPSKSRIRVLQSIGRQLRKSKHKEKAKLFDIADDLHWKKWNNHTLRHLYERIKIYKAEKFNHRIVKLNLYSQE